MWENAKLSGLCDWESLKMEIMAHGIANSLITGLMPTASTAQIMGSTEAFEPITSNIYSRSVLSGSFPVVNKFLQNELIELGIWNNTLKDMIVLNRGDIENIPNIPNKIKQVYKTAWNISNKHYITMSAERGAFVDQSQSLNLFISQPNNEIVTKCHLHGWKSGLKTGLYYLRRKPKAEAQQFTIDHSTLSKSAPVEIINKIETVSDEAEDYGACPIGCTSCQ